MDIAQPLLALSLRRPIFHSEADFQHELAWEIRRCLPDCEVRLERPHSDGQLGATDIVILQRGVSHGIELKYCTKGFEGRIAEENFRLKAHGAQDLRRYDVCKDIYRLEMFNKRHCGTSTMLLLTNDAAYWAQNSAENLCDADFRISSGRELAGILRWADHTSAGTKKGREFDIPLANRYFLNWQDYSDVSGRGGQFRFLRIDIP